ncbi:MAG: GGDEF domain-containing protein [Burkholderiales bacterium]
MTSRVPENLANLRLGEALRLLRQAGYPDPLESGPGGDALLQAIIDGLCDLSLRDGLTGLVNMRHFRFVLESELDRVARTGESASLLMIDIDKFKCINDTHGHMAGDRVLQDVARLLAHNLRPMDTLARYGGEEFGVVLPNSLPAHARKTAGRLRHEIECTPIAIDAQTVVQVTVSIGGASAVPWQRTTVDELIARADNELYRAKREGRNRIAFAPSLPLSISAQEKAMLLATRLENLP